MRRIEDRRPLVVHRVQGPIGRGLATLLLASSFVGGFATVASAEEAPRIREIRFVRETVFTDEEAERIRIFAIANDLHITTRQHVVRRELLFSEGEVLDRELVDATERALRGLEFINEARVEVVPVEDGIVDVEVTTRDAWTIVPGILFESGGGITNVGLTGRETNLAGFGKEIWFEGTHKTDEGTGFAAGYKDPQVWGSRWIASSSGRTSPLVDSIHLSIVRPFYSPDTKWAWGASGGWREEKVRTFEDGDEAGRLRETRQNAQAFVARAMGKRFNKLTAEMRFAYQEYETGVISGDPLVPRDDEYTLTSSAGLFLREERWVEAERIRKMTITEDLELGFNIGGRVGRAGFPVPEGEKRWKLSGSYRHAVSPSHHQYLFFSSGVRSEVDRNTVVFARGEYYLNGFEWQTFAFNVRFARAWKLESSRQFSLGGNSGLRGFPARRFNGNKSLLINAEARVHSPIEILAVRFGSVVFLDTGRAYARGSSIDLDELATSAGFGLRLGFTRAPNEPIGRIDFGWPLTEGGFALTVGAEQQF